MWQPVLLIKRILARLMSCVEIFDDSAARSVLLLKMLSIVFLFLTITAQADTPAVERESYLNRPDISALQPKAKAADADWSAIKAAHFSFIATVLELYPDRDLYFLARDSEHLYDVAKLTTEDTLDAKRIHLINISRGNMRDSHLKEYLEQNGITEKGLAAGHKILYIDTGFAGTIPRVISESFSETANRAVKVQLLVSANPAYPSSRVFLRYLNPEVNSQGPSGMHASIVRYEHISRYFERSDRFDRIDGTWTATSPILKASVDGNVSKPEAILTMQDLKDEWQKPEVRRKFQNERALARKVYTLMFSPNREKAHQEILELWVATQGDDRDYLESLIRDTIEVGAALVMDRNVTLADLGLRPSAENPSEAKKFTLMAKHPNWVKYLENPDAGIAQLIADQNWTLLANFIDNDIDYEINRLLAQNLFAHVGSPTQKQLRLAFIAKQGNSFSDEIIDGIIKNDNLASMTDELFEIANRPMIQSKIADRLIGYPDTKVSAPLVDRLLTMTDDNMVLRRTAEDISKSKDLLKWRGIIRRLILFKEKEIPYLMRSVQEYVADFIFSRPESVALRRELQLLLRTSPNTIHTLAKSFFSKPESVPFEKELIYAIEHSDSIWRTYIAREAFSKPHSAQWPNALEALIRMEKLKPDRNSDGSLFFYYFNQPYSEVSIDVLRSLIENQESFYKDLDMVFSQPFATTPKYQALRESLAIKDLNQRRAWLNEKWPTPLTCDGFAAGNP